MPRERPSDPGGRKSHIALDGAFNFRDLGGTVAEDGRLRHGLLYRADALNGLSDADRARVGELGIGLVIDLRERVEHDSNPDRTEETGIRHRYVPLHDNQLMNERGVWQPEQDEQYRLYADRLAHRVAEAVSVVLASDAPVVVHCTAGKDRTGVVIAILLELLRVPRAMIEADYLVSYEFLEASPFWERVSADYRQAGLPQYALDEAKAVPAGSIVIMVLDALIDRYGSLREYLIAHEVPESAITEFRQRMVEVPVPGVSL